MRLLSTVATVSLALATVASAAPQSVTIQTVAVTTATLGQVLSDPPPAAVPSESKDTGTTRSNAVVNSQPSASSVASSNADQWSKNNNDQPAGFAGRKFGQWSTSGGRGPKSKTKRGLSWSDFKAWFIGENENMQSDHPNVLRRAPGETIKGTPVQNMGQPSAEAANAHIETHHYPRGGIVKFSGPSWHGAMVGQQNGGRG